MRCSCPSPRVSHLIHLHAHQHPDGPLHDNNILNIDYSYRLTFIMATQSPSRIRLGVLVPSSNTSLEPLTHSLISSIPSHDISVHFSRFKVTEITLSEKGIAQFDDSAIIAAAQLLADAKVHCIGWSGTSSGWLGFERDEQLCKQIEEATGVPCTTSVLALNKALQILHADKLGLVTPYTKDVQDAVMKNYASIGVTIDETTERHLNMYENTSYAEIDEPTLRGMVKDVAQGGAVAVTTFCTNLKAANYADAWEKEFGIVLLDTVSTVLWEMLRILHVDTRVVKGWGKLFELN